MADPEKIKEEEKLFEKYCPEPDWLNKVKLTKEEKEIYERGKGLVREKFIGAVKSGELKLPEKEKESFEKWQKQEGVKKEIEKESWYEKLMKEKVPTFIEAKIPDGTEYLGHEEKAGSYAEGYNLWEINNWKGEKFPRRYPPWEGKPRERLQGNELVVTKSGSFLTIAFVQAPFKDKRFIEKRGIPSRIVYQPPPEITKKIWDELKQNPPTAHQLIDPELLKLISLPPDLKVVLEEKGEK